MGKIKDTISVVAFVLGSVGTISAGGAVAYDVINQPQDGVDGINGNVWKTGIKSIEEVELGNEGDFYYDIDDYKLYQVENGKWVLKIEGFGQAGATGAQGVQGEKGDKGDQGVQGDKGDQGIQGIQGVQGDKGDQGIQGIQGVQGDKGDQGIQGIQGIQGEPGVKGDPGDKGNTGDKGDPGTNGTNGTDGTSYYSWIKFSDAMPSSDSDMKDSASNFIGIYSGTSSTAPTTYSSYTWFEIKGEKGNTGDKGETGPKGDAGQNGKSVYVGYDGNVWAGSSRTEYKLGSLESNCAENTIELYYAECFTKELVDTTAKRIALTGEYYQNINKFIYSDLTLDEITVYVDTAGDLVIGSINLSTDTLVSSKKYAVTAGKNVIDVSDITIGTNETIYFGGDDTTVKLYKAVGVEDAKDSYGNFTFIPDTFTPGVSSVVVNNSKTEEVLDKLIVRVDIEGLTTPISTKCYPNITTVAGDVSTMAAVNEGNGPYEYNINRFGGKAITEIGVPVKNSYNGEMTIYVVKKAELDRKHNYEQKLTITLDCAKNTAINDWVYTDVTSYNIVLKDDETLAFDYASGGVQWGYRAGNAGVTGDNVATYAFYDNNTTNISTNNSIFFDISFYDTKSIASIEELRQILVDENNAI